MDFFLKINPKYLPKRLRPQNALNEGLKKHLQKDDRRRVSLNLTRHRTFRTEKEQANLRLAIDQAEDVSLPDRERLYALYTETLRDPHVLSQVRTQILKITGSPWAIFEQGTDTVDEGVTRLLQRKWFERYRDEFHRTKYWGHTLIEFGPMTDSADPARAAREFQHVAVFPREHVKSEKGEIRLDLSHTKGIPYREAPWNEWLMEIGDPYDLGLLLIIAREVIWKDYSRSDWSRACEKWGMPIAVIKSASRNAAELDELEKMAANFGSNLWLLLDDQDDFEIKERSQAKGYEIYLDKIKYCDSQIAKVISGQEGTSEQKAYVGAAEVHERILNEYVEAGQREETFHLNSELFPFLIRHGYRLEGKEFRYMAFQHDRDETNDGTPPPRHPDKKALDNRVNFSVPPAATAAGGTPLADRVESLYTACCTPQNAGVADLTALAARVADRVYARRTGEAAIDLALWQASVSKLLHAAQGQGPAFGAVRYGSPEHRLLLQYRYNVQVFAAFKNHHNTRELVQALIDESGQVRGHSAFKKAAGLINTKYHKHWLAAEYNQAKLAARNAYRWQKIQNRKALFPTVEYVGVDDARQSSICRDLNGGIWAADDPLLDTIAPPNHWGCRSFLKSSKKTLDKKTTGEEIKKPFRNNPGKTGDPFTAEHPYYAIGEQYADAATRFFGLGALVSRSPQQFRDNLRRLEKLDTKTYPVIETFNESGGFMAIHRAADLRDLAEVRPAANVLARHKGYGVVVREYAEDGTPNPELLVNGVLSDVKSPGKPYSLDALVAKATKRQGLDNVVYRVTGEPTTQEISRGLRRAFHNRRRLEWVDVVFGDKVARITRELFERGTIRQELEISLN